MRVSALYLTFVLLPFFGSVIASASDSEISIRYRNGPTDIYRLIWSPLEQYMAHTVYYSHVGDLLTVNMDAIMAADGVHLLSECFNLNMVSSTAAILDPRPELRYGRKDSSIQLLAYGGLDYYPDNELWYGATWLGRSIRQDTPGFMLDRSDYMVEELMSDMPADTVRAGLDLSFISTAEVSALKRCGLLFSGAGNTVAGKKPEGVLDGLVFGEDIRA